MPIFEYECDKCMDKYNKGIDILVAKANKTNASKILKDSPGFQYVELFDNKKRKFKFKLGVKGNSNIRKFRWKLEKDNILYIELKDFKFSELIYEKEDEKGLKCPNCKSKKGVRRIFSTFKAIFDDKNKRAPRPGDDIKFHTDYKIMKDEEMASSWVGQDHLNQYFNR